MLSGIGPCDEMITRPDGPKDCGVSECALEASIWGGLYPLGAFDPLGGGMACITLFRTEGLFYYSFRGSRCQSRSVYEVSNGFVLSALPDV